MWITSGKLLGTSGGALAGAESLLMYLVEGLALVGLWIARRKLVTWFLFAGATMGVTTLGLAVTNIGALYRLRYLFLVLLIILAGPGLAWLWKGLTNKSIRLRTVS